MTITPSLTPSITPTKTPTPTPLTLMSLSVGIINANTTNLIFTVRFGITLSNPVSLPSDTFTIQITYQNGVGNVDVPITINSGLSNGTYDYTYYKTSAEYQVFGLFYAHTGYTYSGGCSIAVPVIYYGYYDLGYGCTYYTYDAGGTWCTGYGY
jgi:hypothetical protein